MSPGADGPADASGERLATVLADMVVRGEVALEHLATHRSGLPRTPAGISTLGDHTDSPPLWWHNGGTGGFRSLVAFRPGTRSATAVLTPSTRGVDLVGLGLLRGLTQE